MAHTSRLMLQGSWLKATGSWPRKNWRCVPQAPLHSVNFCFLDMSREPRAFRHERWALSHEPLTMNNRLSNYCQNPKKKSCIQQFKVMKLSIFKNANPNIPNLRNVNAQSSWNAFLLKSPVPEMLRFLEIFYSKNDVGFVLVSFGIIWWIQDQE